MKIGNININFSSDPEFFIKNKETGQITSSIPVVKNTKEYPADLGDGYLCYVDNVSVECSIPVADSKEGFINLIQNTISKINRFVGEKYEAVPVAAHIFPDEELQDPGAHILGCSPFYLSRTLEMAEPPQFEGGIRASGFHLHVGRSDFKNPSCDFLLDPMSKVEAVNNMDLFVGIPSIIFDNSENSKFRKRLYKNAAGSHRPTIYGFEYRPLSSACMRNPSLIGLIYDLSEMAVKATYDKKDFGISNEEVFECMNNSNEELSKTVINKVIPKEYVEKIMEFAE